MTPPDHDDQLDDAPLDDDTLAVNAVVDDEATPEQRRRVARDPELVAQVTALRAAAAAVAAPVDPPAADVLAALRQRALDALDEPADETAEPEPVADDEPEAPAPPPAYPVRDLATARARRTRSLPPLPAVAAVIILLVVVGVGLIVAGSGGKGDSAADGGGDASATAADDSGGGGGDEGGEAAEEDLQEQFGESSENPAASGDGSQLDGPSAARVEELLARSTATYATDAQLLAELREIDPEVLALRGSEGSTGEAPSTTGVPGPDDEDESQMSAALAADPAIQRCDDVLRAGEPELGAATAAALVEIDGVPVMVLSTPVEPTDRAPLGVRVTVLNALDCSPRGGVAR